MKNTCALILALMATLSVSLNASATVLFQDGFAYTTPGNLGANAPWGGGSSTSIAIGNGNLTYTGLADLGGNDLVITAGTASSDTNIFSASDITSGSIYFSFLVDCTTLPTANNYLISLNPGTTKPGGSGDAFAIYTGANGAGWKIGVRDGGSGATYESTVLSANQTYLIVGEYTFGATTPTLSLFLDPTAGAAQPGAADAVMAGTLANPAIGNIGVKSQSATTQGNYLLDNFIIGTTWADVTPTPTPEPGSAALAGVGGAVLTFLLRRRNRR